MAISKTVFDIEQSLENLGFLIIYDKRANSLGQIKGGLVKNLQHTKNKGGIKMGDIYSKDREEMLEDDEIDTFEFCFMEGYCDDM